MDVSECAFCRLPHERTRLRRDYELDICDPCAHGNAPVALRERGHTIDTRTWSVTHESKDGLDTVHHLELIAHAPGDFAFTATFTRENFLDRLSKLFRKELEVGDPLFDDFVFIRTEDRAPTAALLQSSGVSERPRRRVADPDARRVDAPRDDGTTQERRVRALT